MGDRATMMAALQQFGPRGGMTPQGQPQPSLPPMQGGQVPQTGGLEPMPQQAAQGASVPAQQGPLQAKTVLQALNDGARPQAIGRGYGFRK